MGERCKLTQQCISFINNLFRWSGFGLLLILLLLFKILGFRNQSGINRFDLINLKKKNVSVIASLHGLEGMGILKPSGG